MPAKRTGTSRGKSAAPNLDLDSDLRTFAANHPDGWDHQGWTDLLDDLRSKGHDTSDTDGIGKALERERITASLQGVPGVGPARVRKLADHFGSFWNLKHADADQISGAAGIPRSVAERVARQVRG